jgi:hypothetical protein
MATQTKCRTSKRDFIAPRGSKRYVRRDPHGQFAALHATMIFGAIAVTGFLLAVLWF